MIAWKKTLTELLVHPDLHGGLLNTLSLLEYIGARKIMKSQDERHITPDVLAHMTEEIRHAQIMKKLAVKVGGPKMKSYAEEALLAGDEGRAYIQAIDHKAQEVLGVRDSRANYLLTTLIIEERAAELYPFYDTLLETIGLGGPLRTIVREEEAHLAQVIELLATEASCGPEQIEQVRAVEKEYFAAFFRQVEKQLALRSQESVSLQ